MIQKREPIWNDIDFLPLYGSIIDEMLEGNKEQYQTFLKVEKKPSILDDYTIERSLKLYTEQLDDHWVFPEQLKRWQKEKISQEQAKEIKRLLKQCQELEKVTKDLIEIINKIKPFTIDKILAKDDAELALDVLTGKLKL